MARHQETNIQGYVISILISLVLAGVFEPLLGSRYFPRFSTEWWLLQSFFLYIATSITHFFYKSFFIPSYQTPVVPETVSAFDDAIRDAGYNYCAISSKEIALWLSPTFLYYLTLNDIKNILEYSFRNQNVKFSTRPEDKENFYKEGYKIIRKISNGQVHTDFFGIRLLIYPEEVYKNFKEEIMSLIQVHAIARVHCIPVIREELIKKLNPAERNSLQYLARDLNQDIKEEYTALSIYNKLFINYKKKESKNPFSVSIPDFLMINYNPSVREKAQVWWYEKNTPKNDNEDNVILQAEKCYSLLCSKINRDTTWSQYTQDIFKTVPVGILSHEPIDFFSQDYFRRWLDEVIPKTEYSMMKKWIDEEKKILIEVLNRKNNINEALDIGCGWGRHIGLMIKHGVAKASGVDSNWIMVKKFGKLYKKYGDRVSVRLEDAQDISFAENKFDLVICMTNTFGNLGTNDIKEKVIAEINRVLKSKGTFILSVYNNSVESLKLRKCSYIKVGLNPYILEDHRTIKTKEGLISEQFTPNEIINSYLKEYFDNISLRQINEIAFVIIANKK